MIRGDELWVWQEQEPFGSWGVIVAWVPMLGTAGPLMSRDPEVAQKMRPMAENHARTLHVKVRLAHFRLTDSHQHQGYGP